jgi:hypothetical protein
MGEGPGCSFPDPLQRDFKVNEGSRVESGGGVLWKGDEEDLHFLLQQSLILPWS